MQAERVCLSERSLRSEARKGQRARESTHALQRTHTESGSAKQASGAGAENQAGAEQSRSRNGGPTRPKSRRFRESPRIRNINSGPSPVVALGLKAPVPDAKASTERKTVLPLPGLSVILSGSACGRVEAACAHTRALKPKRASMRRSSAQAEQRSVLALVARIARQARAEQREARRAYTNTHACAARAFLFPRG